MGGVQRQINFFSYLRRLDEWKEWSMNDWYFGSKDDWLKGLIDSWAFAGLLLLLLPGLHLVSHLPLLLLLPVLLLLSMMLLLLLLLMRLHLLRYAESATAAVVIKFSYRHCLASWAKVFRECWLCSMPARLGLRFLRLKDRIVRRGCIWRFR